jgi:hypothetical protein
MPRHFRNIECPVAAHLASKPPPLTWLLRYRLVILWVRLSKSILIFKKWIAGSNSVLPARQSPALRGILLLSQLSPQHLKTFSEQRRLRRPVGDTAHIFPARMPSKPPLHVLVLTVP